MAQGKSNHHRLISGTSGPTRISWRPRARRTFFLFSTFFLLGRNRKRIFYLGLSFTVVYLAYLGSVAIYDKFHPLGFQRWSLEGMREYFSWE